MSFNKISYPILICLRIISQTPTDDSKVKSGIRTGMITSCPTLSPILSSAAPASCLQSPAHNEAYPDQFSFRSAHPSPHRHPDCLDQLPWCPLPVFHAYVPMESLWILQSLPSGEMNSILFLVPQCFDITLDLLFNYFFIRISDIRLFCQWHFLLFPERKKSPRLEFLI